MKQKCSIIFLIITLVLTGCSLADSTRADNADIGSPAQDAPLTNITASDTLISGDPSSGILPANDPAADEATPEISEGTDNVSGTSGMTSSEMLSGTSSSSGSPSDRLSSASGTSLPASGQAESFTALHGTLSVDGTNLVDQNGDPIRLYGMSTHGIAWFPQYVSYDTFRTLKDDWNTNCIRLALYTDEYNGYSNGGNQEELKALVKDGIDYATDLGMYVIVDWHILSDQDPNVHKEDAISFFREISSLYSDHTNILYEICNEPNGYATWDSVKSYAGEVIPVIRENDPDAVILVGTPTWCQNIDQAAASPLEFDNVMYTLHFYAATHTDDLRNRLETAVNNRLPVFISEFGMCDASGNGGNDFNQAAKWMELIDKYNISFFCWNLANKAETSSVLRSDCEKISDWTDDDLSESGLWIRERFRNATATAQPR